MYYRLRFTNEPYRYDTMMFDAVARDFSELVSVMAKFGNKFAYVRIQMKG